MLSKLLFKLADSMERAETHIVSKVYKISGKPLDSFPLYYEHIPSDKYLDKMRRKIK